MRKLRFALSFIFAVIAIVSAYFLSTHGQAEKAMTLGLIFSFFSVITIPDSKVEI